MRSPHPLIAELAERRKTAGWSARAAALKAGLGEHAVLDWERGRANPTVGALEQYLSLYGLTLTAVYDPARTALRPVSAGEAAQNRRVLADALGIVDDMPVRSPVRVVRGEAA